jgi:hypothetical protein
MRNNNRHGMAGVMNQQNSSTRNTATLPNDGHQQLQYQQSKSLPNLHPYFNQQEDQNFPSYGNMSANDQAQDLQYENQMLP